MRGGVWLALAIVTGALVLARRWLPKGHVDLTWIAWVGWPLRVAAFHARRALRVRRGPPRLVGEPGRPLFPYLGPAARERAEARERELRARYDLAPVRAAVDVRTYRENLYVLDLLDRHATPHLDRRDALAAVDVGSQDFRYAAGLARWLARAGDPARPRRVALDGVELDGDVIYRDLRSRADHAAAHAAVAGEGVRYRVEDFAAAADRDLDVVFCWFPFVLRYALVQWGLPGAAFAPDRLFARARDALRAGGLLVVVTHTREERAALDGVIDRVGGLDRIAADDARSELVDYHDAVPERAITIARRRA